MSASRPTPGTYYIINKVLSADGDKLAITFNGEQNHATVTPLSGSTKQRVGPGFCDAIDCSLIN